jgi:hypothetical protein
VTLVLAFAQQFFSRQAAHRHLSASQGVGLEVQRREHVRLAVPALQQAAIELGQHRVHVDADVGRAVRCESDGEEFPVLTGIDQQRAMLSSDGSAPDARSTSTFTLRTFLPRP